MRHRVSASAPSSTTSFTIGIVIPEVDDGYLTAVLKKNPGSFPPGVFLFSRLRVNEADQHSPNRLTEPLYLFIYQFSNGRITRCGPIQFLIIKFTPGIINGVRIGVSR